MKKCSKCGQIKYLSEFHKRKDSEDGYRDVCKNCRSLYMKQRYKENRDEILNKERQYRKSDHGKNTRRLWDKNNPDKVKESKLKYNQSLLGKIWSSVHFKRRTDKYPEKEKAKESVNYAIRHGKLPRASTFICSHCHVKQANDYHHPDYSKPLEIIPLCRQCHVDIHHKS